MVENTVGKGEIAHYEQFLLFPQCFQKACLSGASKGVIVWEWVNALRRGIEALLPEHDSLCIVLFRGFEDSSFNIEVLRSQLKRKDAQIKDLKNTIDERDITKARQNVELGRQQFSESGGLRERKVHEDKEELRATIGKLEDDIGSLVDGKIVLENQ